MARTQTAPVLIGVLAEIAQLVGEDGARALAERFGGSEIWIPRARSIGPEHKLALCIGVDKARRLAEQIGHGPLHVPSGRISGRGPLADHVYATIDRAYREGLGVARIARIADCSQSTVERHLRRQSSERGRREA